MNGANVRRLYARQATRICLPKVGKRSAFVRQLILCRIPVHVQATRYTQRSCRLSATVCTNRISGPDECSDPEQRRPRMYSNLKIAYGLTVKIFGVVFVSMLRLFGIS